MADERNIEVEETEVITLEFDDGVEVECEIMGVFDYEGKEYIALIPNDGTDDVYIYGYKEVGEDESPFSGTNEQAVPKTQPPTSAVDNKDKIIFLIVNLLIFSFFLFPLILSHHPSLRFR